MPFPTAALLAALPLLCPQQAPAEPRLLTASTHPMRYYIVEPTASEPERRLPVLVCIAGADADFRGTALRFSKALRGSRMIVVAPCTFSSSNALWGQVRERYVELYGEAIADSVGGKGPVPDVRARLAWDEAGLLAVLADIRSRAGERVYLTGFSAGGLLTWWMALRHPTLLAGAVPVCPNHAFWAVGEADANPVSEGARSCPVRVLSGGRDPLRHSRVELPMPPVSVTLALGLAAVLLVGTFSWRGSLRRRWVVASSVALVALVLAVVAGRLSGNHAQTDIAVRLLKRLGYDVEWTYDPGLGHELAPRRVLEIVSAWP